MSLTADGLYSLETMLRTDANSLRVSWPESLLSDPTVPAETKAHARREREHAGQLDQVADLIAGLAGDWDKLGPMVRQSYVRQRKEYEARQQAAERSKAAEHEDAAA
jgi:hypothetical protein